MIRTLSACLVVCALLAGCDKPAAPPKALAPAAPVAPAVAPADQTALVAVIAADDCNTFLKATDFKGWLVTVDDVETSTVNQSIDITFGAGQHIGLEEVVQTSSPLYAAVSSLHVGDTLFVSGQFTHGNGECSYRLDKVGIVLSQLGG